MSSLESPPENENSEVTFITQAPPVRSQSKADPVISPEERQRQREEEWKDQVHRHNMLMRNLRTILLVTFIPFGIFVLLAIVFFFLPITQMGDHYYTTWDRMRSWANAFVYPWRSFWLTASAIIISDLLKKLFTLLQAVFKEIDKSQD